MQNGCTDLLCMTDPGTGVWQRDMDNATWGNVPHANLNHPPTTLCSAPFCKLSDKEMQMYVKTYAELGNSLARSAPMGELITRSRAWFLVGITMNKCR